MLSWFLQNAASLLIGVALLAAVVAIVVHLIREKRKGRASCSCGGSCSGCASGGMCHPKH